ncbi:MAG: hypothetical protein HGB08_04870 [Candidatus Moranbacteria bacterium]|nr:hypothetical protein [Candidatus Moranbacteria bacterium]
MDAKTLLELKEMLLKEKGELEENLSRIAKPMDKKEGDYETSFDDIGTDREDNATEVGEYTDNLSVEVTLEKRLQEIIEALARMEDGTYGFCENCKKEIDIERLRANPAAKTCIKC